MSVLQVPAEQSSNLWKLQTHPCKLANSTPAACYVFLIFSIATFFHVSSITWFIFAARSLIERTLESKVSCCKSCYILFIYFCFSYFVDEFFRPTREKYLITNKLLKNRDIRLSRDFPRSRYNVDLKLEGLDNYSFQRKIFVISWFCLCHIIRRPSFCIIAVFDLFRFRSC